MIDNSGTAKEVQFYTIQEVADLLKVSYITVFRWIKAGKITAYKVGKQHRIKTEDLDKFISKSKYNGRVEI